MKNILLLMSIIICANSSLKAQKVKFKKGIVTVDTKDCLNYESSSTYVEMITKSGEQTILLKFIRTGVGHNGGLYTKVIFVEQKKSLTSKSIIFNRQVLVKKLISDKVLVDCEVDPDKIDKFIMKYDESIEETLIRQ